MTRLILAVLACLFAGAARAACTGPTGVPFNCEQGGVPTAGDLLAGGKVSNGHTVQYSVGNLLTAGLPITAGAVNGVIYAQLAADGVTSDDVALRAAVDLCATRGAKLVLPPGRIMLTGTAGPITVQNCAIEGAGVPAGTSSVPSQGTLLLLTNTSVKPFVIGNSWSMTGINFFWPNQTTGTTVYPPLLNMDIDSGRWRFFHNTVINAYDVIGDTPGHGQGDWQINDNYIYAMHEVLRSSGQGDTVYVSRNDFTPGPWFNMDPANAHTAQALVARTNRIFHVENNVGFAWNIIAKDNAAFSWNQLFHLDATAVVGLSDVSFVTDQVNTLIDSTSGGNWAVGNGFSVKGNCNAIVATGHSAPCFALGANGIFDLKDSALSATGSILESAGSNVSLQNVTATSAGNQNDGTDYYGVLSTGGGGGLQIIVQDSTLQGNGLSNNAFVHGIHTVNAAARLVIQNNRLNNFQEMIDVQSAPTTMITGNWGVATGGATSVLISGTNGVQYANNNWDKPPVSVLSNCGGATVPQGSFSGFFVVGATNPTTTCSLTFPFNLLGAGGGACQFQPSSLTAVSANVTGNPATWVLAFGADVHGQNVFFNCRAAQ